MISYEAAMATLKTMFPKADEAVVTMVLEANGGHMERTVEQLLTMDIPQSGDTPKGLPSQAALKSEERELLPGRPLPDDFLRPPSYFKQASVEQSQVDQDAELARMLQDEMFLQDLARNPEFYGLQPHPQPKKQQEKPKANANAPAAAAQSSAKPAAAPVAPSASDLPSPQAAGGADDDEKLQENNSEDFRKKFSNLGDAARKKLAALASKFGKAHNVRARDVEDEHYMSLPSLDDAMGGGFDMGSIDDGIELQDQRKKGPKKDSDDVALDPDDL